MNISSRDTAPARKPRTFELRDTGWIEATPERRRGPRWLLVPAALVVLTSLMLILFGAIAALATGAILAVRSFIARLFGR